MKLELEVVEKTVVMYEVKLADKPIREFYQEEQALEFIAENINDYVFMRAIYDYGLDVKKGEE